MKDKMEKIRNYIDKKKNVKEKYDRLIVMSKEEYFKYTHPIRERKVKKMR